MKDQISTALHGYPKKHGLSLDWISSELWIRNLYWTVDRDTGKKKPLATSTLGRYLNTDDPLPFPLDLFVPFMVICNNDFSALETIESGLGRTSIDLNTKDIEINISTIATLTKEAGEVITVLAESIEDGKIDEDERRACTKELLELQRITTNLLYKLNSAESYR